MDRFWHLIRNSLSTLLIRGLLAAGRVLVLLFIAKKFEPSEFGTFILVFSFVEVGKAFTDFGVDTVSIREFTKMKANERFFHHLLSIKIMTATVIYLFTFLTFWLIYKKGIDLFLICALSFYTSSIFGAFSSFYQSRLRMDMILKAAILSTLLYFISIGTGIYYSWPLPFLILTIPLSELVNLLMVARVYRKVGSINLRFRRSFLWGILKKSLPAGITGILIMLYSRMDTFLLGYISGNTEVGEYGVAYRFIEPFLLISGAFSISAYSSLSNTLKVNDPISEQLRELRRIFSPIFIFSVIISVLLHQKSEFFVSLISKKYVLSSQALEILSIALFLKTINMQFTSIINAKGKYGVVTMVATINFAVNLILNLLFIPKYNVIGAAFAVTLTEAINMIMQGFYISRRLWKIEY